VHGKAKATEGKFPGFSIRILPYTGNHEVAKLENHHHHIRLLMVDKRSHTIQ